MPGAVTPGPAGRAGVLAGPPPIGRAMRPRRVMGSIGPIGGAMKPGMAVVHLPPPPPQTARPPPPPMSRRVALNGIEPEPTPKAEGLSHQECSRLLLLKSSRSPMAL